jgi:hypothetical protein
MNPVEMLVRLSTIPMPISELVAGRCTNSGCGNESPSNTKLGSCAKARDHS